MKDLERLLEKLPGKDQVKHLENLLGKDQVKLLGKEVANSSQHAKEKLTESIQMEFAQPTSSLALVELLASWTAQLLSSSIQQFLFVTGHGTSLNALDFQLHSQHAKRTDTSHSDNAHRHSLLALTAVPSSCSVQQDSSSPSLPYVATTSPMFPNAKRRRVKVRSFFTVSKFYYLFSESGEASGEQSGEGSGEASGEASGESSGEGSGVEEQNQCVGLDNGLHAIGCSPRVLSCQNGHVDIFECPSSLVFNDQSLICDYPQTSLKCLIEGEFVS